MKENEEKSEFVPDFGEQWSNGYRAGCSDMIIITNKSYKKALIARTFSSSLATVWILGAVARVFPISGGTEVLIAWFGCAAVTTGIYWLLDSVMDETKKWLEQRKKDKKDGNDNSIT